MPSELESVEVLQLPGAFVGVGAASVSSEGG